TGAAGGSSEGDDRPGDRVVVRVGDGERERDREARAGRRRLAVRHARGDAGGSAGEGFQGVADGGAAGFGRGGGEAAPDPVGVEWRRGRPPAGIRGRGRLIAPTDEAGTGARARLGQREGDRDTLDRLPTGTEHTCY